MSCRPLADNGWSNVLDWMVVTLLFCCPYLFLVYFCACIVTSFLDMHASFFSLSMVSSNYGRNGRANLLFSGCDWSRIDFSCFNQHRCFDFVDLG